MAYARADDCHHWRDYRRRRWPGALAAGLVEVLLVVLVVRGLAAHYTRQEPRETAATLVALSQPRPPP